MTTPTPTPTPTLTRDDLASIVAYRLRHDTDGDYVTTDSLIDVIGRIALTPAQAAEVIAPPPRPGTITRPAHGRSDEAIVVLADGTSLRLTVEGDHLRIQAGVLGQPAVLPIASNAIAVKVVDR